MTSYLWVTVIGRCGAKQDLLRLTLVSNRDRLDIALLDKFEEKVGNSFSLFEDQINRDRGGKPAAIRPHASFWANQSGH